MESGLQEVEKSHVYTFKNFCTSYSVVPKTIKLEFVASPPNTQL